jgi:hypothetical protein
MLKQKAVGAISKSERGEGRLQKISGLRQLFDEKRL